MADLSGYTAVYIRTTGNDTTGDGSSGTPYATAQKGFDIAVATASGNYVLDFGVGSFGGVTLTQDWPVRIAVRGVGATQSFLGGITSLGVDSVYDYDNNADVSQATAGSSIAIVSDQSIDIGGISSVGGAYTGNGNSVQSGGSGGAITLTDCVVSSLASVGGSAVGYYTIAGGGGAITVTGCTTGSVSTGGGEATDSVGQGGGGGAITVTGCTTGSVSSNGANGSTYGGGGGAISITLSTVGAISSSGGSYTNTTWGAWGGSGGNVVVTDSNCGNVSTTGVLINSSDWSYALGSGGNGSGGTATFAGYSTLPNSITAASVVTTNLKKGRGVNGSSILGLI
jgi:hypothetical protein